MRMKPWILVMGGIIIVLLAFLYAYTPSKPARRTMIEPVVTVNGQVQKRATPSAAASAAPTTEDNSPTDSNPSTTMQGGSLKISPVGDQPLISN